MTSRGMAYFVAGGATFCLICNIVVAGERGVGPSVGAVQAIVFRNRPKTGRDESYVPSLSSSCTIPCESAGGTALPIIVESCERSATSVNLK